jgi:amidase
MALHDLTALEQAAAIRRRDVSSVELTTHYLERTRRLADVVGAFALVSDELALRQAERADALVSSVEDPSWLPVLHGVVVPVKDLNRVAGVRTRFGSRAVDVVPQADDDIVVALRTGGTVMTGKSTTPEFGLPAYTEPDIGPYARSPWDLDRGAGGSSGGAAAAVAAGLAPVAHGSDGGGSIRIPASSCGLVGVKPSRGLVPNGPLAEHPSGLGVHGALARTVADAAALLGVLAGRDRAYVEAVFDGPPGLAAEPRAVGPLVVGRYREPVITAVEVHPEAVDAYESATEILESLGHRVVELDVPMPRHAVPHFEDVWASMAASIPLSEEQESMVRPLTRWLRERGRSLTPEQVQVALDEMARYGVVAVEAAAHVDVILTPTLADLPAPIGAIRDDQDPAADFEAQKRFTPFTSPYNITGQPAVSLPLHWTSAGLPVGVQLVGRTMREVTLLGLAAHLERARPWAHRHPEVW